MFMLLSIKTTASDMTKAPSGSRRLVDTENLPIRNSLATRLRQPFFDVALHDHVQYFLAIRDRLIDDFGIVFKMRHSRVHRAFQRLNELFELLIQGVRIGGWLHGLFLSVEPSFVGVGELQTHFQNQGVDLVLVLLARHGIGPPLQTPKHVALRTVGLAVTEHVETFGVPVVHRFLDSFFGLSTFCGKFSRRIGTEIDVPFLFSNNVGILDDTGERLISCTDKLLELEATYAVDEESEHGKIFPGFDLATKGFNVSFLIGPAERIRNIDTNITSQARHFSEMVHFFGCRAGNDQLIQFGRRIRQDILDIEVRAADLTIGLDRQYSS